MLVGEPDDERGVDRGVGLERLLHLLGGDLLARRVDADAAAPEEREAPVRLHRAPVAPDDVAAAVDGAERASRLLRVLVVAERDGAAVRHEAGLAPEVTAELLRAVAPR